MDLQECFWTGNVFDDYVEPVCVCFPVCLFQGQGLHTIEKTSPWKLKKQKTSPEFWNERPKEKKSSKICEFDYRVSLSEQKTNEYAAWGRSYVTLTSATALNIIKTQLLKCERGIAGRQKDKRQLYSSLYQLLPVPNSGKDVLEVQIKCLFANMNCKCIIS